MSTRAAAHATRPGAPRRPHWGIDRRVALGLALALASAIFFGTAGAVGKSLLVTGWSAGATVTVRILLGALFLAPMAVIAMKGRWHLLARPATWGRMALFGIFAVAGAQFFYFLAVQHLTVGVALMLEYLGAVLVVGWLWLRHGQRPRPLTLVGIAASVLGLLLILDVLGDVQISTLGVAFGLMAAVGLAVYFVVGADESTGLPSIAFACFGMAIGGLMLLTAGLAGLVPMQAAFIPVTIASMQLPWWVPLLWLGFVVAALAYGTGVAATRYLGAKVASFVGLTEVMFAVLAAWLLLGEMPAAVQLLGGLFIIVGVICVKIDEPASPPVIPAQASALEPVSDSTEPAAEPA